MELECFRAETKERKQWEAREGRLVEYVAELQRQLKNKETGVEPLPLRIVDKTVEGSDNGNRCNLILLLTVLKHRWYTLVHLLHN